MARGFRSWVKVALVVVIVAVIPVLTGGTTFTRSAQLRPSANVGNVHGGPYFGSPAVHAFHILGNPSQCVVCLGKDFSQAPLQRVAVSASPVTSPQDTLVNLSATVSGGVPPYTYLWNFGDGTSSSASSSNTTNHSYLAVGLYIALVNVSDKSGGVAQGWVQIHTTPGFCCSLTAIASASIYYGNSPLNVTFTGEALNTSGETPTYDWTIGTPWERTSAFCGTNDNQSIARTFLTEGLYEVALCVSTIFGGTQAAYVDVLVNSSSMFYLVTFVESGLPSGTNWSVTLAGQTLSSTVGAIAFNEPNGTHPFTVGSVPGYTANITLGSVAVNGKPVSRSITFTSQLAYVSLTPLAATLSPTSSQGLVATVGCSGGTCPAGANYTWFLNNSLGTLNASSGSQVLFTAKSTDGLVGITVIAHLNGRTATNASSITIYGPSTGLTIESFVALPPTIQIGQSTQLSVNALDWGVLTSLSFTYTGLPPGCSSSNAPGLNCTPTSVGTYSVRVHVIDGGGHSANATTPLIVIPRLYSITFNESGLPSGTPWSVTLNGSSKSGTGGLAFTEPNGTYSFSVGAIAGYSASPSSSTIKVNGAAVTQSITFSALPPGQYSLIFSETGLPAGTNWSVTVGSTTHSSKASTISFAEVNGTYHFSVGSMSGYTPSPTSGTVKVNGGPASQNITFTSSSSNRKTSQTTGFLGLPGFEGDILIGIIMAAVAAGVAILLMRRRTPPSGSKFPGDSKNIADGAAKQPADE